MERTLGKNRLLLKKWIKEQRLVNPSIEADLTKEVRISFSSWKKIIYLDGHIPNSQTRLLLAQFTGINENELFPIAYNNKDEVA